MKVLQPKISPLFGSTTKYILIEDYTFKNITVPRGFIFDGATIPKLFWKVHGHPFRPNFVAAALIHDYGLYHKDFKRKEVNSLFYELLKLNNVPRWKAKQMYWAVSLYTKYFK